MTTTCPARKLVNLATTDLIDQYELAIRGMGGMPNRAMQRRRISLICDVLFDRSEAGDATARAWIEAAS